MDLLYVVLFVGIQLYQHCSGSTSTSSASNNEENIIICRAENFLTAYLEDPDSYHEGSCPATPSPEDVPEGACDQCECWSDTNCDDDKKCCYNGCKNTCLDCIIVAPAPVIDWIDEPPRQRTAGNAWLISGPEEPYGQETCTTTFFEDGGDPLKCPTGYICYIEDEGDIAQGIPNMGICIRE